MQKMIIHVVESENTFSGFFVKLRWNHEFSPELWRRVQFTTWQAALQFLAINRADNDFTFIVR